jgi:hypothetical protein
LAPGYLLPWQWCLPRASRFGGTVLLVDIGFAAGWLWPGTTTWPEIFSTLGHGYADSFPEVFADGYFPALVSAGLLSGLVGGLLLYFVLLRPTRRPLVR